MISSINRTEPKPNIQPSGSYQGSEPKVSIIIPNYNHAQYIASAIQSVLDQDFKNFEIIVVDDGSTDNSQEVVTRYGSLVRYIWQENQGLSAARNTGIRAASGEFIGVLDADDMYEPNFLSTLVSILSSNPDAGAVYCGYQFVDHLNNPLFQRENRLISEDQFYQRLINGNFLVPEAILVRRYCYENVGPFDTSLRACEDWDMWLRIAQCYQIIGTDKVLIRHRILPGSMSSDPARMLNNRLAVLRKHFGSEPNNTSPGTIQHQQAFGRAYLKSTVEYLQYGSKDSAYKCFCEMVKVAPDSLMSLDTLYELSCGDQPKGGRGDFATLDVDHSARVLIEMLDMIFSRDDLAGLHNRKHKIYATAYLTLGLLSYGARHVYKARKFLLRAVVTDSSFVLNYQLITTLLKSLLGVSLVDRFKKYRRRS